MTGSRGCLRDCSCVNASRWSPVRVLSIGPGQPFRTSSGVRVCSDVRNEPPARIDPSPTTHASSAGRERDDARHLRSPPPAGARIRAASSTRTSAHDTQLYALGRRPRRRSARPAASCVTSTRASTAASCARCRRSPTCSPIRASGRASPTPASTGGGWCTPSRQIALQRRCRRAAASSATTGSTRAVGPGRGQGRVHAADSARCATPRPARCSRP